MLLLTRSKEVQHIQSKYMSFELMYPFQENMTTSTLGKNEVPLCASTMPL